MTTKTDAGIFEQAKIFHANLTKLQGAVETAKSRHKAAEDRLVECKRNLASASAKALAADGGSDQQLPEIKTLSDAYSDLETAKLALIGTENAVNAADASALLELLRSALESYRAEQIQKFITETYQPAARLFLDALHIGQGLASALGIKPNLDAELTPSARALTEALLTVPADGNWRGDPVAYQRFEEAKQFHILVAALERHQGERQTIQARKAHAMAPRGSFDPNGSYRVRETLRIRGVVHPIGSTVTQFDMGADGIALLDKLTNAGKIVLLGEEQLVS